MKIILEKDDCPADRVFYSKVDHPRHKRDLRMSHYRINEAGEVTHKTCTCCSQHAGQFVWRKMTAFGFRVMQDRRILAQPQCSGCRGGRYEQGTDAVLPQSVPRTARQSRGRSARRDQLRRPRGKGRASAVA